MQTVKKTLHSAAISAVGLACLAATPAFAEAGKTSQNQTFTAANGNTVEVRRVARENEAGDVSKRRGFKVTDPDGELVRRGHDRARVNADGSKAGAQRREFVDADGNVHQKRRRAQADGSGNARAQRHARVKDTDGNVTKRTRSSARKFDDGSRAKRRVSKR